MLVTFFYFFLSSRGRQPPQSVHPAASTAASTQPPQPVPPVCKQPEQKHPEGGTEPHSRPGSGHRRWTHHPRVGPATGQLGAQQQRPVGNQVGRSMCIILFFWWGVLQPTGQLLLKTESLSGESTLSGC